MRNRKMAWLALLLALATLLSACGEFTEAVTRPQQSGAVTVPNQVGGEDADPFTVTLSYQGQTYPPSPDNPITIQWNDGFSLHTAPLEADGVARISGLDGDYKVTLLNLPNGYTYNPNIYTATNDKRHVEIELYRLVPTSGRGSHKYNDCIQINHTGLYCVEVTGPDHETFFEFAPNESGIYTVESWMDTTADEVDVNANYYGANVAYKESVTAFLDGGAEGTYTKNVKMDVMIADENISAGGSGGAAAFTFGITATQKSGEYPIKVYIAITFNGDFIYPYIAEPLYIPKELPDYNPDQDVNILSGKEFVWADIQKTNGDATVNVLDSRCFKLWPKAEGGDGFYHVYDVDAYPATGGYGPVLYAKISKASRFVEPLSTIEYAGNKALTLTMGEERRNYKYFIEGWKALVSFDPAPNGKPSYFCTKFCPCRDGGCDSFQVIGEAGACEEGCPNCHPECRHIPKEQMGLKGYSDICNRDGCVPVTEELKVFLQYFCINQMLFMDGEGYAETHPQHPVFAGEEDQWLFACGYYV